MIRCEECNVRTQKIDSEKIPRNRTITHVDSKGIASPEKRSSGKQSELHGILLSNRDVSRRCERQRADGWR